MIGSIVAEEELLADDELVMHIRSGDSILEVMDWITKDATTDDYSEDDIVNTAIQPGRTRITRLLHTTLLHTTLSHLVRLRLLH